MKLFSRKSLVAAAASAALVSGVMVAPASAQGNVMYVAQEIGGEGDEGGGDNTGDGGEGDDGGDNTGGDGGTANGSSGEDGIDPSDVRAWIGVFTAIIGALTALFRFIDRF